MTELREHVWTFPERFHGVPTEEMPPGPWHDEPDKVQWIDPATGLDCLIVRGGGAALCGYVGLPPEHPLYEVSADEAHQLAWQSGVEIDVHGGLNFAERCAPGEPVDGVCHVAEYGATKEPWWLGFDTGHACDVRPAELYLRVVFPDLPLPPKSSVYRDVAYVKEQCTRLAEQLARVK